MAAPSRRRLPRGSIDTPSGLRTARFEQHGDDLAVLSFPLPAPSLPASLTAAEREVALALLEGLSNEQIAGRRKT
jgi:DNA-binding NarL/FixJ family response regulator